MAHRMTVKPKTDETQTPNKVHVIVSIHAGGLPVTVYTVYHDWGGMQPPYLPPL